MQNCDEYYSYNALTSLVKTSDDEAVKYDPWELVVEAISRMKRIGDVMRAERLKQVIEDIDQSFDEKNLGMAKFSRFVQEAAQRGLLRLSSLENGQIEVGVVDRITDEAATAPALAEAPASAEGDRQSPAPRPDSARAREAVADDNGRRGRRGRGRERSDRRERDGRPTETTPAQQVTYAPPLPLPTTAPAVAAAGLADDVEMTGERVTREEAFDLVRRAIAELTRGGAQSALASEVRRKARELHGRDSESLNQRLFERILRDAHDAEVIDLRKRGEDYEVSAAAVAAPISAQLHVAAPSEEPSQAARSAANAASLRRGIRFRGVGRGGRAEAPPPELLAIGVVDAAPTPAAGPVATPAPTPLVPEPAPAESVPAAAEELTSNDEQPVARRGRRGGRAASSGSRGRKTARSADQPAAVASVPEGEPVASAPEAAPVAAAAVSGTPVDADAAAEPAGARPRRPRSRRKSAAPAPSEG